LNRDIQLIINDKRKSSQSRKQWTNQRKFELFAEDVIFWVVPRAGIEPARPL
jgi:hypothetical protein